VFQLYIYFSASKFTMVKSKWGLAGAAVLAVISTLTMTAGISNQLLGLSTALWGAELFPYLALIVGMENTLCITRSVVYTPPTLDVSSRLAHGLSQEGYSLTKFFLLEIAFLLLGFLTFVAEIQEFCIFGLIGLIVNFYTQAIIPDRDGELREDVLLCAVSHLRSATSGRGGQTSFRAVVVHGRSPASGCLPGSVVSRPAILAAFLRADQAAASRPFRIASPSDHSNPSFVVDETAINLTIANRSSPDDVNRGARDADDASSSAVFLDAHSHLPTSDHAALLHVDGLARVRRRAMATRAVLAQLDRQFVHLLAHLANRSRS
jgi:hypothetical protein